MKSRQSVKITSGPKDDPGVRTEKRTAGVITSLTSDSFDSSNSPLRQIRLLVVFDALLREHSVKGAASLLGLQSPAVSQTLAQLRKIFGHPLFTRTARGLSPTPFAEAMRPRVRSIVREASDLVGAVPTNTLATVSQDHAVPPKGDKLVEQSMCDGKDLKFESAQCAMGAILSGQASDVEIGEFLAHIHRRGFSSSELAGFVQSLRRELGLQSHSSLAHLDWPCNLSYGRKCLPWFIHAARLVSRAGFRVVLHGHCDVSRHGQSIEDLLDSAHIPVCSSIQHAHDEICRNRIVFLPSPALSLPLKGFFGKALEINMIGVANAVGDLLNPLSARASILGINSLSKHNITREAALLLGSKSLSILQSQCGLTGRNLHVSVPLSRIVGGTLVQGRLPAHPRMAGLVRPAAFSNAEYWNAVWTGAARDDAAESAIIDMTALALLTIMDGPTHAFASSREMACALWGNRHS